LGESIPDGKDEFGPCHQGDFGGLQGMSEELIEGKLVGAVELDDLVDFVPGHTVPRLPPSKGLGNVAGGQELRELVHLSGWRESSLGGRN
jgi:hypothetical protein